MMMTITTSSCICDDPHLSNLYWYRCPIHCREASFPRVHTYINAPPQQQYYHNQQLHQTLIDGGDNGNSTGAGDDRLKQWLEDLTAAMLPRMMPQERCYSKKMDYERLTSFLRHDNSFLTPWNWNPCDDEKRDEEDDDESSVGGSSMNEAHHDINSSNGPMSGEFMQFQPGSFSYYSDKQVSSDFMGSWEL